MTEPKFPALPSGQEFAQFPIEEENAYNVIASNYESGNIGTRKRWDARRRKLKYVGTNLRWLDVETIMSFFDSLGGPATEFYVDCYSQLWRPYSAPTLTQIGGGAKPARTYYVQYTWTETVSGVETIVSAEAVINVLLNQLMVVTLPLNFPTSVNGAKVYVGVTGSGTEKLETTITTNKGTWTEPVGALTQGAVPPAEGNYFEEMKVILNPNSEPVVVHTGPYLWSVTLILQETF